MTESVFQLSPGSPTLAAVERAFTAHVADRLNGQILRYSQRLEFLQAAQRLRISRFRANLLIAMVQHQVCDKQPLKIADQKRANPRRDVSNHSSKRFGPIIASVFVVELLCAAGAWWILHG